MHRLNGFLMGVLASASFGFIPLFSVPLINEGMDIPSILTFRLFFASVAMALLMLCSRERFAVRRGELAELSVLGVCYFFSALLLFQGYLYMSTGIATVLHFSYPVFVTLIMRFFYKQYISPVTIIAILLALTGITLITGVVGGQEAAAYAPAGAVVLVVISGGAYALYLVLVNNRPRLREMNNRLLTLYAMLFCGLYFFLYAILSDGLSFPHSAKAWFNVVLLALVPTLLSNLFLVSALKNIGATLTSVLGAMEPLTAVLLGICFLDEKIDGVNGIGMFVVVLAVGLIILSPQIDKRIRSRLERFAANRSGNRRH